MSSRELDITCDEQGHFPPFTRCRWITSSLESTREQLKQKYKYNSQFSSAQCKSEKSAQTLDSGETKEKEEHTRSSKNQLLSQF